MLWPPPGRPVSDPAQTSVPEGDREAATVFVLPQGTVECLSSKIEAGLPVLLGSDLHSGSAGSGTICLACLLACLLSSDNSFFFPGGFFVVVLFSLFFFSCVLFLHKSPLHSLTRGSGVWDKDLVGAHWQSGTQLVTWVSTRTGRSQPPSPRVKPCATGPGSPRSWVGITALIHPS